MPNGMPMPTPSLELVSQRQAILENSVNQLHAEFNGNFSKLEAQIHDLSERVSASRQTPWQLIVSFAGMLILIVGAGWGLGTRPIEASIRAQADSLTKLTTAVDSIVGNIATLPATYVSKTELAADELTTQNRLDAERARLQEEIEKVDAHIRELSKETVPRGEHQQRWDAQAASVLNNRELIIREVETLQSQVDEIKTAIGGIYNARDALIAQRDDIERLEQQVQELLLQLRRSGPSS